jgi:hypothetical protein
MDFIFDLDLYLNQTIGAEVKKEGQSTVSTQILSEIVRKIPDKEIILKQDAAGILSECCSLQVFGRTPYKEGLDCKTAIVCRQR